MAPPPVHGGRRSRVKGSSRRGTRLWGHADAGRRQGGPVLGGGGRYACRSRPAVHDAAAALLCKNPLISL
jgi:hypothetical protein